MTDNLLPCPFCGGEAEARKTRADYWVIECHGFDCIAPSTFAMPEDEAIAAWNRRADHATEVERLQERVRVLEAQLSAQPDTRLVEALSFAQVLVDNEQEPSAVEMAGRFRNLRNSLAAIRAQQEGK